MTGLRFIFTALLALAWLGLPATLAAAPPLEVYGRLPGFETAKISPSGDRLAIIGTVKDARKLIVTEGDKLILAAPIGTQKVRDIAWAGNDIVLVRVSKTATLGIGFTTDKTELSAMVVVTISTGQMWSVFDGYPLVTGGIRGFYGAVERGGRWYGYFGGITLGRTRSMETFFDSGQAELYEVDLAARKHRLVGHRMQDGENYRDWVIGADGQIAASLDFLPKSGSWAIRNAAGIPIARGLAPTGDITLIGLGRASATVLYLHGNEKGERRLIELPLSGGEGAEILPDVYMAGYHFDRRNRQFIGYVEEGDIPEDHFVQSRREKVMAATRKAFPGVTVALIDWNDGFDRLIVKTSGPGDPDSWWHVDIKTGNAKDIGAAYPMASANVGPMRMLRYKAGDGLEMAGVLTLPPGRPAKDLPLIMLPHGGPTARDYPVFDWQAQAFASRGYAVFQPNFRGSTGSGSAFIRAGWGEWGRKMQTDISDGLAELVKQGIVDPKRVCIAGVSYGGYAALAGVTIQQGLYRCAISVAGIGDVAKMLRDDISDSGADRTLMRSLKQEIGSGRDMKQVSPVTFASRADAPVLLIHGQDDIIVPFSQSRDMLEALRRAGKPAELVTLRGEDHGLSKSETRLAMLKAAIAFVEQHNPPDPAPK